MTSLVAAVRGSVAPVERPEKRTESRWNISSVIFDPAPSERIDLAKDDIVWITKYRYKVLEGALRERIRTIIRQVCKELGVQIVSGVLSREHVHMFVEIPPHIAVSDFVRCVKGRSSHRVQMEFPDLRKRYWGRHFWARGYFCTTSGNRE